MYAELKCRHRAAVVESVATTIMLVWLALCAYALWAWLLVSASNITSLFVLTALRSRSHRSQVVLCSLVCTLLLAALILRELR